MQNAYFQGQIGTVYPEPVSDQDLHGRVYQSLTLKRQRGQWANFPRTYMPDRPYRITRDLTIMHNATLTIEQGVEVSLVDL